MNRFSSQQRKLTYLGVIVILLIPIVILGYPSDRTSGGGVLSSLRQTYDLGESDIGEIDPTSAAMNLALLGLRGVAVNQLWLDLERSKDTKNWPQMRATTDSIIRLQPHFVKVWRFNGWNLAFNVSAEWDDVKERFHWVKEGAKFLGDGVARNRRSSEIPWENGRVYGFKIGQSDEAAFFRRYFKNDPDPRFKGGADPTVNELGLDNYLVAKEWYQKANDANLTDRERITDRTIFRSYPARSQLDYASALQRDGVFGETTRLAWSDGYKEWTQQYGTKEVFRVPELPELDIWLEMTADDVEQLEKDPEKQRRIREVISSYQKITNYRYWRTRALCEGEPDMADAHKDFYDALEAYRGQNLRQAKTLVESGMEKMARMLKKYPDLISTDDLIIEEVMTAILLWQNIARLNGESIPADYALKPIWDENQGRLEDVQRRFDRRLIEKAE